jgi:hypothetical protein
MNDFLAKPARPDEICTTLLRWLSDRQPVAVGRATDEPAT